MSDPIPCFINPHARGADSIVEAVGSDSRFAVRACDATSLPGFLRKEMEIGASRILIGGGDGTIATAANVLAGTSVDMAVLPCGTLNHFAGRLGIPGDVEAALDLAFEGEARCVDVGRVSGRTFLNTSTIGSYADFVRVRERWDPRVRYYGATLIALFQTLLRMPTYDVSLEVNGDTIRYRTPLLFVGVGTREPSLFTTRGAPAEESALQVFVVRGTTRSRLLVLALAFLTRGGKPLARTPHLDRFLVTRCTVDTPQEHVTVSIDGELVQQRTPVSYSLRTKALRVVAPP